MKYCKIFLIEFRNLDNPLFGYKAFRKNKYFPINWLRVYNSLHSRTPLERLSVSRKRQINKALKNGAYIEVADNDKDITLFSKMLKKAYSSQVRKHFPDLKLFPSFDMATPRQRNAKSFWSNTKIKLSEDRFAYFSNGNAYLWFSGGMRKTYAFLYPGVLAVWAALTYAGKKDMNILSLWMPDSHSRSTVTVNSSSASVANKVVPAAGSASVGSG